MAPVPVLVTKTFTVCSELVSSAGLAGLDLELGAIAAAAEAAEARAAAAEAATCERDAALAEARSEVAQLRADQRAAECVPCAGGKVLYVWIAVLLSFISV